MGIKNDVVLYGADGTSIYEKTGTPELNPEFLQSWYTLFGSGQSDNVKLISKEPYANHAFVYAVVSAIAGNISRLIPVLFKKETPEELIFEHPILNLLENPNPLMQASVFREAVLLNLLLPTKTTQGGQCFIIPSDANNEPVNIFRGELPTYLYPFSDELIKPHIEDNVFKGWDYVHPSGKKIFYYNDQIIRIHLYNPYNWLLGLSPLSSLRISVANDAKHAELSDKILDNSANIGGLLTTDSKLNKIQADTLKNMWQSQYEGLSKAGKTALLHSGLRYENTSKTLVDIQFTEQRKMNREEIMAVYGVGKTILGLTDGVNRATAKVEKELFWEDTLIPYMDKFWDGFNNQMIKFFGKKDLRGGFDIRHVEALKRDVHNKIKASHTLIRDGVPANVAFATVDLSVDLKNSPWLFDPLVTEKRINLRTGEIIGIEPETKDNASVNGKSVIKSDVNEKTIADDKILWEIIQEKTIDKPMATLKSSITKFFIRQRNKFQDNVDEWLSKQNSNNIVTGVKTTLGIKDLLISITIENESLITMTTPIYTSSANLQIAQISDELGGLVNDFNNDIIKSIIKQRQIELLKINTTTFKNIEEGIFKVIEKAILNRSKIYDLAKEIKSLESDIYKVRINSAKTIARTEISAIASRTRISIMKSEGIKYHRWITANDLLVRETHKADQAVGEIKIGDTFPNSGLTEPLGEGDIKEIVNCRCITIAGLK